MKKKIVSPWMKTQFSFQGSHRCPGVYKEICFDKDRGIIVYRSLQHSQGVEVIKEIYFASVYNMDQSAIHKLEHGVTFDQFYDKVLKIPSRFTKDGKDRYFICVIRSENNLEFVEFTKTLTVSYCVMHSYRCLYEMYWFKDLAKQFDLKPLNNTIEPLGNNNIDQGLSAWYLSDNYKKINLTQEDPYSCQTFDFSSKPQSPLVHVHFARYVVMFYNKKIVSYDLLSKDLFLIGTHGSLEPYKDREIQFDHSLWADDHLLDFYGLEANDPFILLCPFIGKYNNYLINLEENQCFEISKYECQIISGVINITRKGNRYLIEKHREDNPYLISSILTLE
jgi:hypothetical protein